MSKENEESNLFYRAIKFSTEREKFSLEDLFNDLGCNEKEKVTIRFNVGDGKIFTHNRNIAAIKRGEADGDDEYRATAEDFFRLLEYQELKEARMASRRATYFAGSALIISFIATSFNIWFEIANLSNEVNIPEKLYNKHELSIRSG